MDPFDEKGIKQYIKFIQKERLLPKGFLNIQNVESFVNKYKIFRCKITPIFRKPYYINIMETVDGKFKEVNRDDWDNFNF